MNIKFSTIEVTHAQWDSKGDIELQTGSFHSVRNVCDTFLQTISSVIILVFQHILYLLIPLFFFIMC